MPQPINKELLGKIGTTLFGAGAAIVVSLVVLSNCIRLHYDNLRLGGTAQKLRQDPLLRKYSEVPPLPETLDAEAFRALAEKHGLDFVSSQNGDASAELVFTGDYSAFLNYLRALSGEPCGEIVQIALGREQKIIIKGEKNEK